ncbi:hypothetical protein DM40_2946 [Burkholderia cenocepacia]|nr:hypothetical protein DM40_2946 [Burkholderia cenocepacia]
MQAAVRIVATAARPISRPARLSVPAALFSSLRGIP